jgi:hypothetical protein
MSKGFLSALGGIALTLLGWFGPWEWPSTPGIVVFDALVQPTDVLAGGAQPLRIAVIVLLITVNVLVWAIALRLIAYTLAHVSHRARARAAVRSSGESG